MPGGVVGLACRASTASGEPRAAPSAAESAAEPSFNRISSLPPAPRVFVEALADAGIKVRVSHVQPDGIIPIYVAVPVAAVRRFVPKGAEVHGQAIRFWDDWVIAFCDSPYAE